MTRYRILFCGILLFLSSVSGSLWAQSTGYRGDRILEGLWESEEEGSLTRYERIGQDQYRGVVVKVSEKDYVNGQPPKDVKNPDKLMRDRLVEGMVFIEKITYDPQKDRWYTDKLYHPRLGFYVKAELVLTDDNTMEITGRKMGITRTNKSVRRTDIVLP